MKNCKTQQTALIIAAVLAVALFVLGLGLYNSGNMYGYLTKLCIYTVCAVLVALPFMKVKAKNTYLLAAAVLIPVIVALVRNFGGIEWRFETKGVVSAVWPLICFGLAELFSKYLKKANIFGLPVTPAVYMGIMVFTIWLTEEILFKYEYFSSDVISEIYMYLVAVFACALCFMDESGVLKNKKNIALFIAINGIIVIFWFFNQDRLTYIYETLGQPGTAVDREGDLLNWASHRMRMLKSVFTADASAINTHFLVGVQKSCSVAWFSFNGGAWISIVISGVQTALVACVLWVSRKKSALVKVICAAFTLKYLVGVAANLFIFFLTTIGFPMMRTSADIIPLLLLIVLLFCDEKTRDMIKK